MTKVLRKTIMKRSELQANYIKSDAIENLTLYKIKRNFCSKLFLKNKKILWETRFEQFH